MRWNDVNWCDFDEPADLMDTFELQVISIITASATFASILQILSRQANLHQALMRMDHSKSGSLPVVAIVAQDAASSSQSAVHFDIFAPRMSERSEYLRFRNDKLDWLR